MKNLMFDAEAALFEALEQSDLRPIQKLRIRTSVRYRPRIRAEILGAVTAHCVMEGLVSEAGEIEAAIDWQSLLDAIIKYLPTILSLFALFI